MFAYFSICKFWFHPRLNLKVRLSSRSSDSARILALLINIKETVHESRKGAFSSVNNFVCSNIFYGEGINLDFIIQDSSYLAHIS